MIAQGASIESLEGGDRGKSVAGGSQRKGRGSAILKNRRELGVHTITLGREKSY